MNIQLFDFSINVLKVIPWQSDQSPNLRGLLEKYQLWYSAEHTSFWTAWERDVFNLNTANDFGLNVWSIILDLPLYLPVNASPKDYPAFGFAPYGLNFDNGNFGTDTDYISELSTEQKRQLLKLRWWQITSSGTIPDINRAMADVFGAGNAWALDGFDMSVRYIFTQYLPDSMLSIIEQFDILPRPSGVKGYYLIQPRRAFNFGPYGENFDQFYSQFAS